LPANRARSFSRVQASGRSVGGQAKISSFGFTEVKNAHKSGKQTTKVTARSRP